MDKSRLATIIFDSGRKLFESEYTNIYESINEDKFSLDPIVTEYKKKEAILESLFYILNDGSRVLLSEETVQKLSSLNNKNEIESFMQTSKENFKRILGVLDGN